nr:hypothetical protein L204_03277 [Cryptococcus depauperatus CBS 7855]
MAALSLRAESPSVYNFVASSGSDTAKLSFSTVLSLCICAASFAITAVVMFVLFRIWVRRRNRQLADRLSQLDDGEGQLGKSENDVASPEMWEIEVDYEEDLINPLALQYCHVKNIDGSFSSSYSSLSLAVLVALPSPPHAPAAQDLPELVLATTAFRSSYLSEIKPITSVDSTNRCVEH